MFSYPLEGGAPPGSPGMLYSPPRLRNSSNITAKVSGFTRRLIIAILKNVGQGKKLINVYMYKTSSQFENICDVILRLKICANVSTTPFCSHAPIFQRIDIGASISVLLNIGYTVNRPGKILSLD